MPRHAHAMLLAFVCALPCTTPPCAADDEAGRPAPARSAESAPAAPWPAPQEARPLGAPPQETESGVPSRPDEPTMLDRFAELGRVGAALGVVLGLAFLARAVVRRMGITGPLAGGGRPSGVLSVLARYPISRGQHLVLLQIGGRVVLVHQCRQGLRALTEITGEDEVADLLARVRQSDREGVTGRFQSMLARIADDPGGRTIDGAGNEVIDLTRRRRGGA